MVDSGQQGWPRSALSSWPKQGGGKRVRAKQRWQGNSMRRGVFLSTESPEVVPSLSKRGHRREKSGARRTAPRRAGRDGRGKRPKPRVGNRFREPAPARRAGTTIRGNEMGWTEQLRARIGLRLAAKAEMAGNGEENRGLSVPYCPLSLIALDGFGRGYAVV